MMNKRQDTNINEWTFVNRNLSYIFDQNSFMVNDLSLYMNMSYFAKKKKRFFNVYCLCKNHFEIFVIC